MEKSLALVVLSTFCVSAQFRNDDLDFTLTLSKDAPCADYTTSAIDVDCHVKVPATKVFSVEIGGRRGTGNTRHITIARMEGSNLIIPTDYMSQRLTHTNLTAGILSLKWHNPASSEIHTYYCSASYIYLGSLKYSEAVSNVTPFDYPGNVPTCSKTGVEAALHDKVSATHTNAGKCPDEHEDRPEAFVMKHCNSSDLDDWKAGPKVMDICCMIPAYTPIATFTFGMYLQNEHGVSGVFLGCLPNGFSMAVQVCGHAPMILNLTRNADSSYVENPDHYHVMVHSDSKLKHTTLIG